MWDIYSQNWSYNVAREDKIKVKAHFSTVPSLTQINLLINGANIELAEIGGAGRQCLSRRYSNMNFLTQIKSILYDNNSVIYIQRNWKQKAIF